MRLFALATTGSLVLLALACLRGEVWIWVALAAMALLSFVLDSLTPWPPTSEGRSDAEATQTPAADLLLAVLGTGALIALPVLVRIIAEPAHLAFDERLALFLAGGLWVGQVAHPAAEEMIHRQRGFLRGLGIAVYSALLFGHHASAHLLVHHRHAGTLSDPNTARAGEGFYRFLIRAWPQNLWAGLAAERALRARREGRAADRATPYKTYVGLAVAGLTLAWLLADLSGVLIWLAFGACFGFQVLLSDYVQHYGLAGADGSDFGTAGVQSDARKASALDSGATLTPNDRIEAALPQSWIAPRWFASTPMRNAPLRQSHPPGNFADLPQDHNAPVLPWPLPVARLVALFPPLWCRRMQPLLARRTNLARQPKRIRQDVPAK